MTKLFAHHLAVVSRSKKGAFEARVVPLFHTARAEEASVSAPLILLSKIEKHTKPCPPYPIPNVLPWPSSPRLQDGRP